MTKLIEFFLADELSGIERKRARIALLTVFFLLIWGPTTSVLYWMGGSADGALGVVACTVVVASFPFALRATANLAASGYLILVPLYGLLMWLSFILGGLNAPPLSWLVLVPIFAMLFQGTRPALGWLVVVLASWIGIGAADVMGYPFASQLSAHFMHLLRILEVIGLGSSVMVAFLLKDGLQNWLIGEVRRKEAETRAVLETAPDGILTVDIDGRVGSANPAAARIFGQQAAQLRGRDIRELVAGLDAAQMDASDAVFGDAREYEGHRGDGETFPTEVAFGSLSAADNAGVVLVLRDITERKLAQDELRRARDEAVEASRAKSAFLANMSHELRTPLNAVIGYSEMIIEEIEFMEADADVVSEFLPDLTRIRTAGKHLLAIINDILDLSKIEAGRMTTHVESFEVPALLDDIAATLRPVAEKNDNTLQVDVDDGLVTMRSDMTKVRQILFNLLSNACKFTRGGTVALRARLDRAADEVVFDVEDTGVGMSPEQLDKIFEAFVQADSSTTREFGGTGLGLTITSHFCVMLGGEISVESTAGEGSTFTVRLAARLGPELQPAASEAGDVDDTGGAAERTRGAAAASLNPERDTVLVIDDDPTMRDLLRRMLEREGFQVATAASGSEGLLLATQLRPTAITLDVMMPAMDGWTLLARLKEDAALATIPVVMLTMVAESSRGYALGADHFLVKPVDRGQLLEILAAYRGDAGPQPHGDILVVEDDEPTRHLIGRVLAGEGWSVVEAENGRVGLDKLAQCDPVLVLLDLMMPEMDGFEFMHRLRQDDAYRDVPVVVVTAKELTEEDRAVLHAGASEIVAKGGRDQDALLDEVRRQVRRVVGTVATPEAVEPA